MLVLGEDDTEEEGLVDGEEEAETLGLELTLDEGDELGDEETEVEGEDDTEEDASTSVLAAKYPPAAVSLYFAVTTHTVDSSAPLAPAIVSLIFDPTNSRKAPVHTNCFPAVKLAFAPVVEDINS